MFFQLDSGKRRPTHALKLKSPSFSRLPPVRSIFIGMNCAGKAATIIKYQTGDFHVIIYLFIYLFI